MVGLNVDGPARDRVFRLMQEKDRIESEIRDQHSILETNHIGLNDPLVDAEGFPRSDIDVYQVRHARHRIICLQNDHKNIMRRIEQGLVEVHSEFTGTNSIASSQNIAPEYTNGHASNGSTEYPSEYFATVMFVSNGSPADEAGIREGDKVLQFGSITHSNFVDMPQVMNIVAHSIGQRLQVIVKRDRHVHNLTVVPRPWAQPGLLGCQINRRVA